MDTLESQKLFFKAAGLIGPKLGTSIHVTAQANSQSAALAPGSGQPPSFNDALARVDRALDPNFNARALMPAPPRVVDVGDDYGVEFADQKKDRE